MNLPLRNLEQLDDAGKAKVLAELLSELDLDSPAEARMKIFVQLQKYEAAHKITSADMFDSADCEKREIDPELDEWATLYRCYKEIA